MYGARRLPKFRRPPLIEVVHGVQFRRLPMTIAHPGLFFDLVKERYPRSQTVPPLPPILEDVDSARPPPTFTVMFAGIDNLLPRAWFISNDDTMLIQLQSDRLLLNWRQRSGEAQYPHFESVAQEFRRVYSELEEFAGRHELGAIEPNQCEMTYINHIARYEIGAQMPPLGGTLRLWGDSVGPEWDVPLDDLSFNARYPLRRKDGQPIGRLSVTLSTLLMPRSEKRLLQLELTARGAPDPGGWNAVSAFHAMAHERIVNCFSGITTDSAHEEWERSQ
ncbi:MAG: TIGR04255 family protein [Acetobacteraceae bacterium]